MRRSGFGLLLVLLSMPIAAQSRLAHLTVDVRGLEPTTGAIEVSIFNSAETFLKKPLLQKKETVNGNAELAVEFAGLLEGEYAVVVVHDENGNGALDTGFFGFGGESFGYSNDAWGWFGRPSFEAARFTVGTEDVNIEINLD